VIPLLFTEKEAWQEKRNNGACGGFAAYLRHRFFLRKKKLGKKNEIMPCAPASRATYGTASFEKKLGKKSEKEQALDHGRKSQVWAFVGGGRNYRLHPPPAHGQCERVARERAGGERGFSRAAVAARGQKAECPRAIRPRVQRPLQVCSGR
jgi:hypothetical protein